MRTYIVFLAIYVCLIGIANAKLYKWVDENGVTHYSNTAPPQSAQVETSAEAQGETSSSSPQSMDSVIRSYKMDALEHDREKTRQRSKKPSGKSEKMMADHS